MNALDKLVALGRHKDKLWRAHCAALVARVRRVHPETGGHLGCAHNWGNDAARRAIAQARESWRRYSAHVDARQRQYMLQYIADNHA